MRAAEIIVNGEQHWHSALRIQTDTDANVLLCKQFDVTRYVEQYGDVEVVYNKEHHMFYVHSLDEKRNKYIQAKVIDCARHGSE